MIWKQFTHLEHFPPKLKSRFNSFLTTEFDDSISVEMQLRSVIKWCQGNFKTLDTLIDFINDISNWLKQFETNFDTKLEGSVSSVLSEWQASGQLDNIINDVLQWQLDDYIATNEQDKLSLTAQLQQTEQSISSQLAQRAKHQTIANTASDNTDVLDLKNFAQQGTGNDKRALVIHNYTDNDAAVFDNVGTGNTILKLANAQNPTNRPDKPADFVGDAAFIEAVEHDNASGLQKILFYLSKTAAFVFTGVKGTAEFIQSKTDLSTSAFTFRTQTPHGTIFGLLNGLKWVLSIKNDVNFSRTLIQSGVDQTSGMMIEALKGNILLRSEGGYVTYTGKLKANSGNTILAGGTQNDAVEIERAMKMNAIASTGVPVGCLFVDVADNKLKYKDNNGVINLLY